MLITSRLRKKQPFCYYTYTGCYNRLWLTWIVGVACFLRHQLAAVLDASFSVFWMMFESSQTKRMGGDDHFGDDAPTYTYVKRHENGWISEIESSPALLRVKISFEHCASCFCLSGICQNFENRLGKVL